MSVALKRQTKVNQEQAKNFNKKASKLRKSVEELTELKNKIVDKDNHEKNLRRNSLRKLSKLPEKNLTKRSMKRKIKNLFKWKLKLKSVKIRSATLDTKKMEL